MQAYFLTMTDIIVDTHDMDPASRLSEEERKEGIDSLVKHGYLEAVDEERGLYRLNMPLLMRPCLH